MPSEPGKAVPYQRNIELKALDPDPARTLAAALELGAQDCGYLHQVDTYFGMPGGRLKLRDQWPATELIYYERSDEPSARESRYKVARVADPTVMKNALTEKFGVVVVVEKSRHLLIWRDVRIHLDEVRDLGRFIELEAVVDRDSDLVFEHERIRELQETFGIAPERVLAGSYSDQLIWAREEKIAAANKRAR